MKYLVLIALLLFSGSIRAELAAEPMQLAAMADYDREQKVVMYATSCARIASRRAIIFGSRAFRIRNTILSAMPKRSRDIRVSVAAVFR